MEQTNNRPVLFLDSSDLRNMVQLYDAVKALMLYGEEISPNSATLPQILKELRDAFDHMMRVCAAKLGIKINGDDDYQHKNFDKSFGHVYRAAYDTLDWVNILLKDRICLDLDEYSPASISAAIPEYYSTIKPRITDTIPRQIATVRANKDIGAPSREAIEEYLDVVEELKGYHEKIVSAGPALIEYSARERKGRLRGYIVGAIIGAAITSIGIVVTLILT